MGTPAGYTAFTWIQKQGYDLAQQASRLRTFYEEWPNLTTAQKNTLKARATSVIDTVVVQLADLKNEINAL